MFTLWITLLVLVFVAGYKVVDNEDRELQDYVKRCEAKQ